MGKQLSAVVVIVAGCMSVFALATPAQTPTPKLDFNDDGEVDYRDLLRLGGRWHQQPPSPAPDGLVVTLPQGATAEFVRIEAGTFVMGSDSPEWARDNERPRHKVTFAEPFYIQATEFTQRQWLSVMGPLQTYEGDDHPVHLVNYNDALSLVAAMNTLGQGTFDLPSEAQWEYACRAGTTTVFSFGDSDCDPQACTPCVLDDHAVWCNSTGTVNAVFPTARRTPNPWGLFDMHGNVWEWCRDNYNATYDGAPTDGSAWEEGGRATYVLRGGSSQSSGAQSCSSSYRIGVLGFFRQVDVGVRLVRRAP